MEVEKRKRGRPRKEMSRSEYFSVRLSEDEIEMLKFICEKRGENRSEVLRSALKTQFNLTKFQD